MTSPRPDKLAAYLREHGVEPAAFVDALALWARLGPEEQEQFRSAYRRTPVRYVTIQAMFNTLCKSYPKVRSLSEARKKTIRARFNAGYSYDDFTRLFELAEGSDFLKGGNARGWRASFDWLIADSNMAKVLSGNYSNQPRPQTGGSAASYDLDELERYLNTAPIGG